MAEKKPKLKTIQMRDRWRAGKWALNAGVFACPLIPASVILGINWDEWFNKAGVSLPFGFASLLVTVVGTILAILNSDTVFKKGDIALFVIGALLALVGVTDLFLASLLTTMGYMWLIAGGGLVGSATCYKVEKKVIEPNLQMYQSLIEQNCLDAKSRRQAKREEQARKDAEADRQAQAID